MRLYIIFTLILLGCAEFKREFNIIQLSSENIQEVIEKFQYTFIKFYASFCQQCKDLEPDFKAVAAEFQMNQEDENQIALAEIDCMAEAQTCEEFKIEGFPTMQLFASDQSRFLQYNGEKDGNSIYMWLNSAMKVQVQELNTQMDVKRWVDQANSYIGFIFFAISQDDPLLQIYKNFASKNRKFSFALTLNIKSRDDYNISVNSNVVVFKSTQPKQISFQGELNADTLKDWLDAIELPKVVPIESAIEMIFQEKKSVLLLFINELEKSQTPLNAFTEIQKNMENPDDIGFVFVDIHNPAFDELSKFIGVNPDPSKLPFVALFEPDNNFNKYHFNQELNLKNIQEFFKQIKDGVLNPYIRSQAIPLTNDQKVKIVVTDNFQELVLDQKQDIVLVYYAPWCNICDAFLKVYEEVADLLNLNPNIIFAKIDATSNDIDFYDLQAYPTILFYVNGSKNDPVLFESDINSEEIIDYFVGFLQSKTSYSWKIRDDNPMNTEAFNIEDLIELVDDL